MVTPRLMPGYAFLLGDGKGPGSAFLCHDFHWEIWSVDEDETVGARHMGTRSIDGTRCNVFVVGEGTAKPLVYAQTLASGGG